MDKKIYHVLQFQDVGAVERANELLEQGWKLLHVGMQDSENSFTDVASYTTVYVVGATKQQWDKHHASVCQKEDAFSDILAHCEQPDQQDDNQLGAK